MFKLRQVAKLLNRASTWNSPVQRTLLHVSAVLTLVFTSGIGRPRKPGGSLRPVECSAIVDGAQSMHITHVSLFVCRSAHVF